MKKGLTELVFILDRSGSMAGLESDTIGGFNGMLTKQKKEEGEANITTVLFDDSVEIIHDRFSLDIVEPLTDADYYVRGCTALLDAVGSTILKVENIQKHLPEDNRAEKIVFVITTDGQENASKEFTSGRVKKMIEACRENGWQFIFLGANIDAVKEADKMGIPSPCAATYRNDAMGVQKNFAATANLLHLFRTKERVTACEINECMDEVREYNEKG